MSKRVKVHLQHQEAFDSTAPVVATFRNGPPPLNQRKDLAFEVFENPTKKQRLVVASSDKVAYQGANFGYLGSSHDYANYAVGVYDKKTKEVRLCNVNQIYVMQQAIKNLSENVDDNRGEDKSFMEKRRDLVEVFGSKKSKRIQKNREENIVDLENISGAASVAQTLQKKISDAKRKLEEERAQDGSYSKEAAALAATRNALLPPCDIDAPTPDRVYDLTKFMDSTVMDSLTIMAEEIIQTLQTTSVAEYAASLNLAALPTRLMLSLPAPYDVNKMCLIVYVAYMIDFYNSHFPIRKSAAVFSEEKGIPLVIV
ncbi:RNA polymerase I associated factor, A49-like protein, partial [Phytophthora palmivora]